MYKCFVIVLLFAIAFIAFSDTAVLSSGVQPVVQQPVVQQAQPVVVQQQQPAPVIQVQQPQPVVQPTVMMSTAQKK
ncbi:hypothetical protein Ddc_22471 [Ditylenchus destructor]|nr:hypothetical protein Ddc_22471 [Ditylenchus destructor]